MTQPRSRFEQELRIIPTGWAIVAAVSFIVVELVFQVVIPHFAPHDLPPQPWLTLMGIFCALLAAASFLLIGYIYADAKRRGMNALLWTLLVIVIPKPIGFIAYFLLRKPLPRSCPNCTSALDPDFTYCQKCGHALAPTCGNCGRALRQDFVCCPYCGKNVATAQV